MPCDWHNAVLNGFFLSTFCYLVYMMKTRHHLLASRYPGICNVQHFHTGILDTRFLVDYRKEQNDVSSVLPAPTLDDAKYSMRGSPQTKVVAFMDNQSAQAIDRHQMKRKCVSRTHQQSTPPETSSTMYNQPNTWAHFLDDELMPAHQETVAFRVAETSTHKEAIDNRDVDCFTTAPDEYNLRI